MESNNQYKHLGPRRGSLYSQFFVKGTNTRAETVYRETVGRDPLTPEEVAKITKLPLEAVLECVRYCEENEDLLREERDRDYESMKALGLFEPPLVPPPRNGR